MKLKFVMDDEVREVACDQHSARKYYVKSIQKADQMGLMDADRSKGEEA